MKGTSSFISDMFCFAAFHYNLPYDKISVTTFTSSTQANVRLFLLWTWKQYLTYIRSFPYNTPLTLVPPPHPHTHSGQRTTKHLGVSSQWSKIFFTILSYHEVLATTLGTHICVFKGYQTIVRMNYLSETDWHQTGQPQLRKEGRGINDWRVFKQKSCPSQTGQVATNAGEVRNVFLAPTLYHISWVWLCMPQGFREWTIELESEELNLIQPLHSPLKQRVHI